MHACTDTKKKKKMIIFAVKLTFVGSTNMVRTTLEQYDL